MKQVIDNQYIIYTIGHGTRTIEQLITVLKQNNIEVIVDVRSVPYSRFHPQFRQINLKVSLENAGINYLWLGEELGGRPVDPALYHNGKVNYEAVKETELFKAGIERVLALSKQMIKVTLMCSESDQEKCHRKHLISDNLSDSDLLVVHINKTGQLEEHTNNKDLDLFS